MHRAQHINEEVLLVLPVEEVLSHPCALELRVKHKRKKKFSHMSELMVCICSERLNFPDNFCLVASQRNRDSTVGEG
jgi:hypothetical protein